jgi:serralysin
MEFSIMTYRSYIGGPITGYSNGAGDFAQSLMMFDIHFIQQMYGANYGTNSADTTYSFSVSTGEMFLNGIGQGAPIFNRIFRTIWDGNGVDTYDFSNYTTSMSVDLTPGNWVDLDRSGNFQRANLGGGTGGGLHAGHARAHIFNAIQFKSDTRSLIENAVGGSGDDVLIGNIANNRLVGGAGSDAINGGDGNDTINGGDGNDTINGGSGDDTINEGAGNDTINGEGGNDSISGGDGNDTINGGGGNDTINEGGGDDTIIGGDGNDTINGGGGNDTINGGGGTDVLTGSDGSDTFVFQFGQSTINSMDRITDFIVNRDKICLLNANGQRMSAPSRLLQSICGLSTLGDLVNHAFLGWHTEPLGLYSAMIGEYSDGGYGGRYLIVNDGVNGYQAATDLLIDVTGCSGYRSGDGFLIPSLWFV